jgi:hypothetical protein
MEFSGGVETTAFTQSGPLVICVNPEGSGDCPVLGSKTTSLEPFTCMEGRDFPVFLGATEL